MLSLCQTFARAQAPQNSGKSRNTLVFIKAGRLVDVRAGRVLENQGILIENDRVKAVGPFDARLALIPPSARIVDLSKATVLPGLSDCHTHVLLQGDITAE